MAAAAAATADSKNTSDLNGACGDIEPPLSSSQSVAASSSSSNSAATVPSQTGSGGKSTINSDISAATANAAAPPAKDSSKRVGGGGANKGSGFVKGVSPPVVILGRQADSEPEEGKKCSDRSMEVLLPAL